MVQYDVLNESDKHLALVLSQYKKSKDLNYTISCYCTEDFELTSPEPNLENQTQISATWSTYSAGGPIGCDTFDTNPQYAIFIPNNLAHPKQSVTIQISVSSTATTAVNALLIPVKKYGEKLQKDSDAIIDTGKYRHGFVVSNRTSIPSGAYTLVVSNYHVGQTGFYTLKMSLNVSNFTINKI